MRTTAAWAFWRRAQYIFFFSLLLILVVTAVYFNYFHASASCFDGDMNGGESGVDCGGDCARICEFEVIAPSVQWARSFKINEGQYNAVAYVENRNSTAATRELRYTFSLYDNQGLITERTGTTILPPDSVYPIFEGRIFTGDRIPTRTLLDIEMPEVWLPASHGRDQFTIVSRTLSETDLRPRLSAVVRNNSLEEAKEVEVIATIFDRERNALTSSRTIVENFAPRSETDIVFTWPLPIAKTVRSCEIPTDVLVAIDLSGSMADDGGDPPEPITSVLSAAERFISRLGSSDQVGVITFATNAAVVRPLSNDRTLAQSAVANLSIGSSAERAYTNTGEAFTRAAEEFVTTRHDANARKVLVLLTDGLPTTNEALDPEAYAIAQAKDLKNMDVEIYTIGLGENVNFELVQELASDTDNAYQVLSNADIDRIYQTITTALCEEGPAVIEIIPKTPASFQNL